MHSKLCILVCTYDFRAVNSLQSAGRIFDLEGVRQLLIGSIDRISHLEFACNSQHEYAASDIQRYNSFSLCMIIWFYGYPSRGGNLAPVTQQSCYWRQVNIAKQLWKRIILWLRSILPIFGGIEDNLSLVICLKSCNKRILIWTGNFHRCQYLSCIDWMSVS